MPAGHIWATLVDQGVRARLSDPTLIARREYMDCAAEAAAAFVSARAKFARIEGEFGSWWVAVALTVPHVACGTVLEALKVGGDCEWSPLVLGQGDGANRVVRAAVGEVDQNLLAGGSANESSSKGRAFTIGWVFLSARVIAPTIPRVLPPLTSTPRRSPCSQNLPVCSPGVKRGSSTCAADGASAAARPHERAAAATHILLWTAAVGRGRAR